MHSKLIATLSMDKNRFKLVFHIISQSCAGSHQKATNLSLQFLVRKKLRLSKILFISKYRKLGEQLFEDFSFSF
jgi:hypothetical protein